MKFKKYRIVRDVYAGYECQVWRIWFPFWVQVGGINTFHSLERAKEFLENGTVVWKSW